MNDKELKPCWNCNETEHLEVTHVLGGMQMQCPCGVRGPLEPTFEGCYTAWNARAGVLQKEEIRALIEKYGDPQYKTNEFALYDVISVCQQLHSQLTAAETKIAEFEDDIIRFNEICVKKTRGLEAKLKTAAEALGDIERNLLGKNHSLDILAQCVADLWHAVGRGVYDTRGFVGDVVLPMQETLLEIGVDVRVKPLNTEALTQLKKGK